MKTLTTLFLSLSIALILTNCSSDNERFQPVTETQKPQEDTKIPMESLADIGVVEIAGLPKMMKKFENGILTYWAQYYYSSNGKLIKVRYSHPNSESTIFSDIYHYDIDGRLVKLYGHDIYDFYWDQEQIVEIHRYNGMWSGRSEIFYEYNNEGKPIKKLEINIDFNYQQKLEYTYFEDGNLKSIEDFGDYDGSGVFTNYKVTNYEGYNGDINLFPEVQIIPGQNGQNYFPSSMAFKHLTESGYNFYETYDYKYDTLGRVIEKLYGNIKTFYDYY